MRLLILIASFWALAASKPEMYKEKEDFQFSRSSSDDGSKSGYYGAQRGNMGGNYEKAHNMDNLAQRQMSTLVNQVDGELGEGANTRTGSVFSAANSRGIYGSGQHDFSNLKGRNFAEGTSFGDKSSLSSMSDNLGYSGYDNLYSAANNARYSNSHSQSSGYSSGYQTSGLTSQHLQTDEQKSADNIYGVGNSDYDSQSGNNYMYNTQRGSQTHTDYDQSNTNLNSASGYDYKTGIRLINARPARVYIRPGTRVFVPVAAQTYDASQNAIALNQDIKTSDAEIVNAQDQQLSFKPLNNAKHYESSYSYRKEWEKHNALPATITTTENPFPKNSELYEDTQSSQSVSNQHAVNELGTTNGRLSNENNAYSSGYSANTKTASSSQSRHNSQTYASGSRASNGYYLNRHNVNAAANLLDSHNSDSIGNTNSQVEDIGLKPKSYQSSYSYHKSWERRGDPYVITPAGSEVSGQTSQRLTAASASHGYSSHKYNCGYCTDESQQRVRRSLHKDQYSENQNLYDGQEQLEQSLGGWAHDLGQQTNSRWENLADLGQQNEDKWDNLESLNQQPLNQLSNLEDLGQQNEEKWDNLESLNQPPQNQLSNLEDLGQQTQNQWDNLEELGQHTQNQWEKQEDLGQQVQDQWGNQQNLGQEIQNEFNKHENVDLQEQSQRNKLEELGQQTQHQWDELGNLGQQTQGQWYKQEYLGQETQNQWDKLENAGQQTQNQWNKLDELGQQTQNERTEQEDLSQQNQNQWNKLEDLGQHTDNQWNKLDELGQQTLNEWSKQDLGQQTQNQWDKLGDLSQPLQSHNKLEALGQESLNQWNKLGELGQQTQSQMNKQEDLGQQTQYQWSNLGESQQTQSHWDKLENVDQQSQSKWKNLENFGQHSHSQWNQLYNLDQQGRNLGQESQSDIANFGQEKLYTENKDGELRSYKPSTTDKSAIPYHKNHRETPALPYYANNKPETQEPTNVFHNDIWDKVDKMSKEAHDNFEHRGYVNTHNFKLEENQTLQNTWDISSNINQLDQSVKPSQNSKHEKLPKSSKNVQSVVNKINNTNDRNLQVTQPSSNSKETQDKISTQIQPTSPVDIGRGDIGPEDNTLIEPANSNENYKTPEEIIQSLSLTKEINQTDSFKEPLMLSVTGLNQQDGSVNENTLWNEVGTVHESKSIQNNRDMNSISNEQQNTNNNSSLNNIDSKETNNESKQMPAGIGQDGQEQLNFQEQNLQQLSQDFEQQNMGQYEEPWIDYNIGQNLGPFEEQNIGQYLEPLDEHISRQKLNFFENADSEQSQTVSPKSKEQLQNFDQQNIDKVNILELQRTKKESDVNLNDNIEVQMPVDETMLQNFQPKSEKTVEQSLSSHDNAPIPIEPNTEKPGFWGSVWHKTKSAKDSVVSWFRS